MGGLDRGPAGYYLFRRSGLVGARQNLPIIVQSLGPQFQSGPTPNPIDLESNVATTVIFTIAIGPTGLNKDSVTLHETDETGNKGVQSGS